MVAPYWPIANSKVETFKRTLGKAVKCAHIQEKNWKDKFNKFLLQYQRTPHSVTQWMPSNMFSYEFKTDIPIFQKKQQKNHHKTLPRLDGQHKKKSKQYTDNKRNAKLINISKNDIVLAKDIHPKNKLSTFYELNPCIVKKVYKRSAKIKNNRGEYVQAKAHLKVLQGDKSKVNIQESEKTLVTKTNTKSKQPYPFHIPYDIPFVPDEVKPNAKKDQETVNSEDESNISEDSVATFPYALFLSPDLSDLDGKPNKKKDNQNYQLDYKTAK